MGEAGPGVLVLAHVVPGRWVLEGFVPSSGSAVAWASRCLGLEGPAALEALAEEARSEGPLFLPFLAGVGTPDLTGAPRGRLVGLHLGVGPAELARAVLEGVVFEARRALESMAASTEIATLRVVRGSATAAGLRRLADGMGLELTVTEAGREASLLGAAALAFRGAGRERPPGWPPSGALERVAPGPSAAARQALEARYRRYLRAVASCLAEEGA